MWTVSHSHKARQLYGLKCILTESSLRTIRISKKFENIVWYFIIPLVKKSATADWRSSFSCFLSYSKEILPDSRQFILTRGLLPFFSRLIQFITFVALRNTSILQRSCKNQPWSPFATLIYQPVCILWTTCKVSRVEQACITLEKVNLKRYATGEGSHTKMAKHGRFEVHLLQCPVSESIFSEWTPG